MIVLTVEEQKRLGRAARAAGGYIALARLLAKNRKASAASEVTDELPVASLDAAGPAIKAGNSLIPLARVHSVDIAQIEEQIVYVKCDDGNVHIAEGFDAIEIVMQLKPSAIEGRRLKWRKGAWRFHNWFGHPVMDLLAMLGFKKQAIRWHDYTTPRLRDLKKET